MGSKKNLIVEMFICDTQAKRPIFVWVSNCKDAAMWYV